MRNLLAFSLAISLVVPGCSEEANEPATTETTPNETVADDATGSDLLKQAEEWLRAEFPDTEILLIRQGLADLDGDEVEELFAYVGGSGICGTGGCPLVVLRQSENGLEEVLQTSVTQLPVGVLDTTTNGMRDIWVTTYGGGAPETLRRLTFDGETYPSNPTGAKIETIEIPGTAVITEGELTPIQT